MDCTMEQNLKKMAVHMYGVYSTPVTFMSHPRRSVGLAYHLRIMQAVLYMAVVVVRNLKKVSCHLTKLGVMCFESLRGLNNDN